MTGPITWAHLAGFLAGVVAFLLVPAIREARRARRAAELRLRARELADELGLAYAEQRARDLSARGVDWPGSLADGVHVTPGVPPDPPEPPGPRPVRGVIFYDDPPQVAETDKGQDEA